MKNLTNKQKDLILDLAIFCGISYKKALRIVKKVWQKFKKYETRRKI